MEKDMKKSFFLRNGENQAQQNSGTSVIGTQLLNAVQYKREPSFFDSKEVKERDRELLQELKAADKRLNLRRNNKPVLLQNAEAKLLFALAYIIGLDRGDKEIQRRIADPYSEEEIVRVINITELSKLMNNGSSRQRERKAIRDLFLKLHSTFQITPLTIIDPQTGKERNFRHTAPLLRIKDSLEELSRGEEEDNIDLIKVEFGRAFFINLNTRFAPLPKSLFEVWSKKKGGELFHVLLSTLLYAHTRLFIAAAKTEERVTKENNKKDKNLRLKGEELREKIREEQAEVWKFELTYPAIKEKVARDYSSTRQYRNIFKKDLEDVIATLKEFGLITDARITKEGRAEPKVTFFLNGNFNKRGLLEAPTPGEEQPPKDSGK